MSDNETQADIAVEMRTYFQTQKRNGNPEHRPWHQVLSDWADRIDAAAKREMAKGMSKKLDGNRSIPGNAAAMREALREMRTRLVAGIHDGSLDCYKALEIVESALAEPPRNCDIGETDDQQYRFERLCNTFPYCTGCPVYKRWGKRPKSCGIIWAQMPYEKEGGAQ